MTKFEPLPFVPPADSPGWFLDNIQCPGESHYAAVDGDRIHFLSWNLEDITLPALVLVHGFAGHTHWWSFLAPFFADRYRVIAIDLPGMGDSSYRDEYDRWCYSRAILAVIHQYRLEPVTVIGHSFGGTQSMHAMTLQPEVFSRGIVIDSNIRFPQVRPKGFVAPKAAHKRHPTLADCMARFVLTPPQPEAIEALVKYVSYHACTCDENGWYWKFDPWVRSTLEVSDPELLTNIAVRVDLIYGEHSVYNSDDLPQLARHCFPELGELIIVPGAYHHVILDHPLELVESINKLLASEVS